MANNSVLLLGCIDGDHSVMREKFRGSTMPSKPSRIRTRDGTLFQGSILHPYVPNDGDVMNTFKL